MEFNRSNNAKRNIIFGVLNKLVSVFLPFILRTVMIQILGAEYLGLNSLFSSVLQVLNLAELGFSEAIVYSMYRPIANNDTPKICALLKLYRKIYFFVGCVVLIVGIWILPFIQNFIKGSYPVGVNLYLIFLIYLINTVLTYWLFAYKSSLLQAFQRNDIVSKIDIVVKIILNIGQLLALFFTYNYYVYLIIMPLSTLINNLFTSWYVDKNYAIYKCVGVVDKKTKKNIGYNVIGLSISKVCATTRNSLDSIFASAYLGLTVTAIYNNYYYVMSAVTMILSIVVTSIGSVVGNSIATETPQKNYQDMEKLNFLYMWIGSWTTVCLFCLFQPFMILWVGREYLFSMVTVGLFSAYFYVLKMGDIRTIYVQGAGLYWQQRYRALGESLANILLNWILVKVWGVTGIVAATLISLFIFNFILSTQIIFKYYFVGVSARKYYIQHIIYAIITTINTFITYFFTSIIHYSGIFGFLLKILICFLVPNLLWMLFFAKTQLYQKSVIWILEKLKKTKYQKFF